MLIFNFVFTFIQSTEASMCKWDQFKTRQQQNMSSFVEKKKSNWKVQQCSPLIPPDKYALKKPSAESLARKMQKQVAY